MKLFITLILLFTCQSANAWQWRITERANCANGQCVPTVKQSLTVQPVQESRKPAPVATESLSVAQGNSRSDGASCPDGRCPLRDPHGTTKQRQEYYYEYLTRYPAWNPQVQVNPAIAKQRTDCQSGNCPTPAPGAIVERPAAPVLRSVMVKPVRRVFGWRPFQRLFGRR